MNSYTKTILLFGRRFVIESDGSAITALRLGTSAHEQSCPILEEAAQQLLQYQAGQRTAFNLPLAPKGTAFQQKIWAALQTIPYGEIRSYGEIAAQIGNPKSARAVGLACSRNPILLLTPCHRVVGKNGSLTGFAAGTDLKAELLNLEQT